MDVRMMMMIRRKSWSVSRSTSLLFPLITVVYYSIFLSLDSETLLEAGFSRPHPWNAPEAMFTQDAAVAFQKIRDNVSPDDQHPTLTYNPLRTTINISFQV